MSDVEARALPAVVPAGPFREAEPEHRDWPQCCPDGRTCHVPRPNRRLPRRTGS
ncbi:hypothetical protein [Streptomyces carpinensis]|uniref:hypothetical protein n=1 Tax=Streptomyces carpinensis TaxID=66369 RepID=UPI001ABFC849